MNIFKSITAWFAGLFKKDTAMTDETQAAAVAEAPAANAAPAAVVVVPVAVADPATAPVAVVATPVNTDTLKSILTALGHDLEAVWDDAIALAKKAL